MNKLGFESYFNYIDHMGMEKMLADPEQGPKLLELARNISVCLHEDWKQNLIREKGTEYQHFRPVKDAEFEQSVLSDPQAKENFLSFISTDNKPLFRVVETTVDGKTIEQLQFDLIRVPFDNLTKKWQEANLDAAKFALCLVKKAIESGDLSFESGELSPEEIQKNQIRIFENFENMAHDVHVEWMFREGSWAEAKLLYPYEYLAVDTDGDNQKDKDRAHIKATTTELTMQPNILSRNRSIVIRAVFELFGAFANEINGLDKSIINNIIFIQNLIDKQNYEDFLRYIRHRRDVRDYAVELLEGENELTFKHLEKLAKKYFEVWKREYRDVKPGLPKKVDVEYNEIEVDDMVVNHKNIARNEVYEILVELAKLNDKSVLDPEMLPSILAIKDKNSEIYKQIQKQNEEDFANFQAKLSQMNSD